MMDKVFIGKFRIGPPEPDGEGPNLSCSVSMEQLTQEEKDMLAGIVRCSDCCCFHRIREDGTGMCVRFQHATAPDGFCAWGERRRQ